MDETASALFMGLFTGSFQRHATGHPQFDDNPLNGQLDRYHRSFQGQRIMVIEPFGSTPDQLRVALDNRQRWTEDLRER